MSSDPFAQIPKKRVIVYGSVAAAVLFSGCAWLLYLGIPPWRVLLVAANAVADIVVSVALLIAFSGGERRDRLTRVDGERPPLRYVKALPYLIAAILILQLLQVLTPK